MPPLPAIQYKGITKRFPGVLALDNVSLDVERGSCHALCGENGAGKSTLGKILAGLYTPDAGEVMVEGKSLHFTSPRDAVEAGIGMVHQELLFCENLSVAENVCLGRLPAHASFVSRRQMHERAKEWLARIGASIDTHKLLGELTVGQQQLVQIATAVARGARVLIFDEPTSSLSQIEAEHLFNLIGRLQADGVTSLYVSHRMEEIFRLCDTVTVLRDGQVVGTKPIQELNEDTLVQMMIGRSLAAYYPEHVTSKPGEELLRVENLSSPGKFKNISFTLRAGEVLGFSGLVGAGRSELAQALFGLDPLAQGDVYVRGERVHIRYPAMAMRLGLGLVPEDRKRHGLVLGMSARANISLPILSQHARFGWVHSHSENELARDFFGLMRVRAPNTEVVAASLSGGNQQKLVLAKWLAAKSQILLLDEPTRGVDVGAKAEIHGLIDQLANKGHGMILISSELPEVINLSTRILVLRGGQITGEVNRAEAKQDMLMRLMAGISG